MATFLTALIWGLGVSLGASIGCMVFVVLFAVFKRFAESEAVKATQEINQLSLAALMRRNELTHWRSVGATEAVRHSNPPAI